MHNNTSKEVALSLIEVVNFRLLEIKGEVSAIAIALRGDMIDVKTAFQAIDQIAPGCLDVVSRSIIDRTAQ